MTFATSQKIELIDDDATLVEPTLAHVRALVRLADEAGYPDDAALYYDLDEGTVRIGLTRAHTASSPVLVEATTIPPAPTNGPYDCNVCTRSFTSPQGLGAHRLAQHTPVAPITCEGCGRVFTSTAGVGGHRRHCPGHSTAVARIEPEPDPEPDHEPAPEPAVPAREYTQTQGGASMGTAMYALVALCRCGHTQRRHEDHSGMCQICDECAQYQGAA